MREYLAAYYEGFTDISPDEVLAALGIGLALAMACSGLCILGRKRSNGAFSVFCGLIFAVSALSMVIGLGHSRFKYMGSARANSVDYPIHNGIPGLPGLPGPGGHRPHPPLGWALLLEADTNGDGQLTPEEAAQYVRGLDPAARGWVRADEIDRSWRHRSPSPAPGEVPPGPPPLTGSDPQGPGPGRSRG